MMILSTWKKQFNSAWTSSLVYCVLWQTRYNYKNNFLVDAIHLLMRSRAIWLQM